MPPSHDLRVVKTRRNIEETFIRLLQQMPFDKVTVRLIVEEALVNKGTFYRHYQDKYDLADQAFARVLGKARQGIRSRVEDLAEKAPLTKLMASLSEAQAEVMPKLMAFHGVPLQAGTMESQVQQLFASEFDRAAERWNAGNPQQQDIPAWAVASLATGYLNHCWKTGRTDDLREYLEAVHRVSGLYLEQLQPH